jgi:hypothetical protein
MDLATLPLVYAEPSAQQTFDLDFPAEDAVRIEELNARANEGQMTDDEEAELEAYSNIGDLLAYWRRRPANPFDSRMSEPASSLSAAAQTGQPQVSPGCAIQCAHASCSIAWV